MAFLKYARASVVESAINMPAWDEVRAKSLASGTAFSNRSAQTKILQKYDPGRFMLSHCTIVASVDVEPSGLPTGRQMADGMQIDRRYDDYLITPGTSKYVNNNHDAWERKLLLGCFKTFVGGENYVEHLQIPEMSKGRIIDAAARDIGDSIYIDILVATDRKHKPLIAAIESGQLQTLSMGCTVRYTQCSKCGNVAEDETQLCKHIRWEKGNQFLDGLGRIRKIAELCGHFTDPTSVKFIEASWVANPAFTGAVLRSILSPAETAMLERRIQVAMSMPSHQVDPTSMKRVAQLLREATVVNRPSFVTNARSDRGSYLPANADALIRARGSAIGVSPNVRPANPNFEIPGTPKLGFGEGQGVGEQFEGAPDTSTPEPEKADALDQAVSDVVELIREKALSKVRTEITKKDTPAPDVDPNRNNTLVREAVQRSPVWARIAKTVIAQIPDGAQARRIVLGLVLHKSGGWRSVQAAGTLSGPEMLGVSRFLDRMNNLPRMAGEERIYRTVLAVGGAAPYGDVESYLAACRRVMGRSPTGPERDALVAKGRIFDLGAS